MNEQLGHINHKSTFPFSHQFWGPKCSKNNLKIWQQPACYPALPSSHIGSDKSFSGHLR